MELGDKVRKAFNRLAKWRMVFASWQLGTRPSSDPEAQAVRDHREVTIFVRVELNAMAGLLLKKGVFTQAELHEQLLIEIDHMDKAYEGKFPGFHARDTGMTMKFPEVTETMKDWRQ